MATVTVIEFNGRARRRDEETKQPYPDDKNVDILNDRAYFISERIRSDLRRTLPVSVNVEVEIEFSSGSIEWVGVVYILDWVARLSDNVGFVEYVVRFVRFIVNRVIRNEIMNVTGQPGRVSCETEARVVKQPESSGVVEGVMTRPNNTSRVLLILTAINTLAIIALLILQIYIIRR